MLCTYAKVSLTVVLNDLMRGAAPSRLALGVLFMCSVFWGVVLRRRWDSGVDSAFFAQGTREPYCGGPYPSK